MWMSAITTAHQRSYTIALEAYYIQDQTLLHLGPNVITFRTLLHLGQLLHLGLQHTSFRPSSFLSSCVLSTIDYGVPVFHNALLQYLKNELVHIEKRALSIILPSMSYNKACEVLGITPITEHHSQLCTKLFDAIVADPNHKLHGLLPQKNNVVYNFRYNRPFVLPRVHTNRANNTFILAMSRLFNVSSHNTQIIS